MKKIVFIETWTNPIYVRFTNEFAAQFPEYEVYFITDAESLGRNALDELSPKVRVIGLRNIKLVRKIAFLPLYLPSLVSKRAKNLYADTIYLPMYKNLAKTLDAIEPDIIQSNVLLMPFTMQAGRYARKRNIPYILRTEEQHVGSWLRGKLIAAATLLNRKGIRHASYVLPWTVHGVDFVHSRFPPAKKKVVLLPAGVDTTLFTPKKTYSTKKTIQLLTAQRFVPYKDYPTLLAGLRKALDAGAQLHLSIVGSGPMEAEIRALIKALRLEEHITFLPAVPYEQMPKLLRCYDALVHTGRHEAIGMVVPEAMACGVPAIVCDSAGAVTYVKKNTGIVFKTGDADDLARVLGSLTQATLTKLGTQAAKSIKNNYSTQVIVREYGKLVRSIVS